VKLSTFAEIFMEQNFGPHMEQKCASLKPSSGSVSSCIGLGRLGVERESELLFPVETVAGAGKVVVAVACAGAVARDIGGMRRNLVGDDALPSRRRGWAGPGAPWA
jgi:hypothetical protein